MKVVLRIFVLVAFGILAAVGPAFASATNIYITQSGSPSGNCTSNVQTPAFFNSPSNWGSGASQIGPGTTVLICGTFTGSAGATEFNFQGSGASGNTITLQFDTGAQLTAPYWSGNGAINCSDHSYTVVDGGTNGLIQNTANGTSLTYHQTSTGYYGSNCTNTEIKNLTIKNIYINQGSSSSASDTGGSNTTGIVINSNSTNSTIHNNTVSSCKTGIQLATDSGGDASNTFIYNNTISDIDWGVNIGGGDSGDTINPVNIHDNDISNWTNWQFPTGAYHQDGIILFNVGNQSAGIFANIYNNYIHGDLGVGSPTGFIYCADFSTCTIYNNVLINSGHLIYGIMWLGQSGNMGKNMYVYNNLIVTNNSGDICITLNITSTADVEGNICTGNGGGTIFGTYHTSLSSFAATVAVSDHNNWNVTGNAYGSLANGNSASYSSWKSLGYEPNSSQSNPNLNPSAPPYTLQSGSAAIGLGANLTSLGISGLNTTAPMTFGVGGSCGNGCVTRATSGSWDAGVYSSSGSVTVAPPTGLSAVVQ